jgi:Tfp pilus assembly protein PilW
MVALLAGGLISLLLLNGAVNQDSFELNRLQKDTDNYTDEEQALQQDVDRYKAPDALDRRARELGMVPGGNPAFLNPDGTVRGDPTEAGAAPPARTQAPSSTPPSPPQTGAPTAGTTPTTKPSGGASPQTPRGSQTSQTTGR